MLARCATTRAATRILTEAACSLVLAEPLVHAIPDPAHEGAHDAVRDPNDAPLQRRTALPALGIDATRALLDHLHELAPQIAREARIANDDVRLARHEQA